MQVAKLVRTYCAFEKRLETTATRCTHQCHTVPVFMTMHFEYVYCTLHFTYLPCKNKLDWVTSSASNKSRHLLYCTASRLVARKYLLSKGRMMMKL